MNIRFTRPRAAALAAAAVSGAAVVAGCGTTTAESPATTTQATTAATVATTASTPTVATSSTAPTFATTPTVPTSATSMTVPTVDTGTDTGSDTVAGRVVPPGTFVNDVQDFAQTLTQFGLTLQSAAEGPAALRARSATMRGQLDRFDEIVVRMGSYRVEMPALETRRAAIVEASPDVSRLGRELLDAAEKNDSAEVQRVATDFIKAIERLQKAAEG